MLREIVAGAAPHGTCVQRGAGQSQNMMAPVPRCRGKEAASESAVPAGWQPVGLGARVPCEAKIRHATARYDSILRIELMIAVCRSWSRF